MSSSQKKRPYSISMSPDLHDRLRDHAEKSVYNKSELVCDVLERYLKQAEDEDHYHFMISVPKEEAKDKTKLAAWLNVRFQHLYEVITR